MLPCLNAFVAPVTQSWLGILIMVLLVAYHYVTADPKFEAQQAQQS